MSLQIGGSLSPGFEDPLGLLSDCHRRIERFLETLLRVTERADGGELDAVEREGLETALRYFAGMATKHTADEESSLFPRLRARLAEGHDPDAGAILRRLDELEAEHLAAAAAHDDVERLGRTWLTHGTLEPADLERLHGALTGLQATYTEHIAHEDHCVFPLAARVLRPDELAEVGREMAARRGSLTCSERKRQAAQKAP